MTITATFYKNGNTASVARFSPMYALGFTWYDLTNFVNQSITDKKILDALSQNVGKQLTVEFNRDNTISKVTEDLPL